MRRRHNSTVLEIPDLHFSPKHPQLLYRSRLGRQDYGYSARARARARARAQVNRFRSVLEVFPFCPDFTKGSRLYCITIYWLHMQLVIFSIAHSRCTVCSKKVKMGKLILLGDHDFCESCFKRQYAMRSAVDHFHVS